MTEIICAVISVLSVLSAIAYYEYRDYYSFKHGDDLVDSIHKELESINAHKVDITSDVLSEIQKDTYHIGERLDHIQNYFVENNSQSDSSDNAIEFLKALKVFFMEIADEDVLKGDMIDSMHVDAQQCLANTAIEKIDSFLEEYDEK